MSGLTDFLMREVEMPLVAIVADMEDVGYPVDVDFFRTLKEHLKPELAELLRQIQTTAGDKFNPKSSKQLRQLLYETLHLEVIKRTAKSQEPSTDGDTLKRLQDRHGVIPLLQRYRGLQKVVSTYCPIADQADHDGRLRVDFNQLDADTGRFASPSIIQTIPKNDDYCLRNGFRARPGFKIVAADFAQQELRVLAQVSNDKNLQEAITANIDLHGLAAVKVFHLDCAPNEVKDQHPDNREQIKAVQFGLIYGRAAQTLADNLNITREAAQRLIADYFEQFPAVKQLIKRVHADVLRQGFVDDMFGRRRYYPDAMLKPARKAYERMSDAEKKVISKINAAKRSAQNFVIQGASATIMKLAMIRCHKHIAAKYRDDIRMILTLHDELQFEGRDSVVPQFAEDLPDLMCNLGLERFGFTVPMAVEVKVGPSWGELTTWNGGQGGTEAAAQQ
jgi:DNA polymerase I